MILEPLSVDPARYVVLDVETNGLGCRKDDLLSISLFKPDDGLTYDRFLPLELNDAIPREITAINGIRKKDVSGKKPLSQEEVNELFDAFELDRRIILHYGALDEKFIRAYFERHGLGGFSEMKFFNFKKLICSSKFSDGSMTKDNFCDMFGIEGVSEVHSGHNDCILEWKLFEAIGGRRLLVTTSGLKHHVFALSEDYIVPVSYLSTYPNLSRLYDRPYICCSATEIKRFTIPGEGLKKFPTNFSGMTIEHLINVMLDAEKVDSSAFLISNKSKLEHLGCIDPFANIIPMSFNSDGTVTAARERDKSLEREINEVTKRLEAQIEPLVEYIKNDLLGGKRVLSQELVVNEELGIMALCDLTTADAILEIKTFDARTEDIAEQIYYESKGRSAFLMTMQWNGSETLELESVDFVVHSIDVKPGEKPNKRRDKAIATLRAQLEPAGIELIEYTSSTSPIKLKCKVCSNEWSTTYQRIKSGKGLCPHCNPIAFKKREPRKSAPRTKRTPEESLRIRRERFAEKVDLRSSGTIEVALNSYTGGKENVVAICKICRHKWVIRADHLLARCNCPRCR